MKRLLFGLLAVCGLLLGTAALLPSNRESSAVETMVELSPPAASRETYVIGEYEGRVAVFAAGEDAAPREITSIRVHYLPSADRNALKKGIGAAGEPALAALLEDLGS